MIAYLDQLLLPSFGICSSSSCRGRTARVYPGYAVQLGCVLVRIFDFNGQPD